MPQIEGSFFCLPSRMIQGCTLPRTLSLSFPSPSPLTCSNDHPCKGWDLLWSLYRSLWSFGKCAWARRRAGFQKRDNRPPFRTLTLESSPAPAPWRRSLPSLSHEAFLFLRPPKLSGLPIGPSKATETIRETSAGINPPPRASPSASVAPSHRAERRPWRWKEFRMKADARSALSLGEAGGRGTFARQTSGNKADKGRV